MLHRNGTNGRSFTWNGIMQITTVNLTKIHIVLRSHLSQETVEQLIGIGTVLINIITRMTTSQALDSYLKEEIILRSIDFRISKFSCCIGTTGTTDEQFAFIFRVKINQDMTVHESFFQSKSTCQTSFFINRKETFQRTMLNIISRQDSQLSRHTDTIVSTQSCTLCLQPFTVDISFNRVIQEIMVRVAVLFTNHINMRLENHGLQVFQSRSSRFFDQNITSFILFSFQALLFSKVHQVSNNLLFLLRRTWHLAYFSKIMEY